MFSNIRMRGGSHDATDANAAHYTIQNILKSGIIKSAPSANVSVHTTSISTVIIPPTPTMTIIIPEKDLQFDLPDSINESIAELRWYYFCFSSTPVAVSASVLFVTYRAHWNMVCSGVSSSRQYQHISACLLPILLR
jgi:hypothetical protein